MIKKLFIFLMALCWACASYATVSTNEGRNEYTATAAQTVFNYTFKIYEDTDLDVYITASGDEPNDAADITTAYTVTGAGDDAGGTITLTTGATLNDAVTIVSSIPTSRTVDYQFNGDFRPDIVNDDFDRAVSLVKQIEDGQLNTLRYQNSVQDSPGFLLAPVAGNVIGYDGAGAPTNYDLAVDGNSWDGLADLINPAVGKGSDLVAHTSTANTVTEAFTAVDVTTEALRVRFDGVLLDNMTTGEAVADITATSLAYAAGTESYDTNTFHDDVTNNNRITIPTGVAKIRLKAFAQLDMVAGTAYITASIRKNGAGTTKVVSFVVHGNDETSGGVYLSARALVSTAVVEVNSGDYFDLLAYQKSGGPQTVESWFSMEVAEYE